MIWLRLPEGFSKRVGSTVVTSIRKAAKRTRRLTSRLANFMTNMTATNLTVFIATEVGRGIRYFFQTDIVSCLGNSGIKVIGIVPNPDEVAEINLIRLKDLIRPDSPEFETIRESDRPVLKVRFGDDNAHAPTAAVIHQFCEIVMRGRKNIRVDHVEQALFAWK